MMPPAPTSNATTAMMPPAPSSMKLLIDTRAQRVLFAEAGKDVTDFILGLVAMPMGAVERLLHPEGGSPGCIADVYASAEEMDVAFLQGIAARNALLVAGVPAPAPPSSFSANVYAEPNHALPLYRSLCDVCNSSRLPQGFVKDLAKYTIMDNLTVTPTTNVSSFALLKSLGVKSLEALEERTVHVGHEEAIDILKAALRSKTVLTDVFLKSKRSASSRFHYRNGTLEQISMRPDMYRPDMFLTLPIS